MRLPHAHSLYVHGHGPLHRAPAAAKLVGLAVVVAAVALTPRDAWWALGIEAAAVAVAVGLARLSPGRLAGRLLVGAPFVAFAVVLPLVGTGDRVDVGPLSLSVEGLWATWSILAKSTLSLGAAVVVTATTTIPDLLIGLARLRVPRIMIAITGLMVRYLDVLIGEARRMRIAMKARGFRARRPADGRAIASGAAALLVRSHERGERVYAAMLARGYRGVAP